MDQLSLQGENWEILIGDVRAKLKNLASKSVHVVIVSPPYWSQRDYGFPGQIGLEETPQLFIESLVEVFREVKRVLRDDGLLFVNLGDTYNAGGRKGHGTSEGYKQQTNRSSASGQEAERANVPDLSDGDLIGIPWMFALTMRDSGWTIRRDIIWHKPSAMPESVTGWRWMQCRKKIKEGEIKRHGVERGVGHVNESRVSERKGAAEWEPCPGCDKCRDNDGMILRKSKWRPSTAHEYVFMFTKSSRYFADGDSSKEPCTGNAHSRGNGGTPKSDGMQRESGVKANEHFHAAVTDLVETRNLRSVWSIVAEGLKARHFAAFPTELVRRCLSASTSRGGCCSKCGQQHAPIVRSERKATRPGNNTKVGRASAREGSPYENHNGMIVGNRDPQRHTTITAIDGFKATCDCKAEVGRPVVLDCFAGACRTGRVAINMGCRFIGIEGSEEYAKIGAEEIQRPYDPEAIRKKKKKKQRSKKAVKILSKQLELDLG